MNSSAMTEFGRCSWYLTLAGQQCVVILLLAATCVPSSTLSCPSGHYPRLMLQLYQPAPLRRLNRWDVPGGGRSDCLA